MAQKTLCCMHLTTASRLIALFGLVASLTVINLLVSELTDSQGGDSVGILLGMDYDKLLGHAYQTVRSKKATDILKGFLGFAIVYAASSLLLLCGTILEQRWCAIPWLICEALSVLSKLTGIVIHERSSKHTDNILVVTTSILFLGVSLYLWIVVWLAQRLWGRVNPDKMNVSMSSQDTSDDEVFLDPTPPRHATSNMV